MDLFTQMVNFVRAQQVIAFSTCVVKNDYDHLGFLTKRGFVCKGYNSLVNKDHNVVGRNILLTHFLFLRPMQLPEINWYYTLNRLEQCDQKQLFKQFSQNSTFIDYDMFVEIINKENESC